VGAAGGLCSAFGPPPRSGAGAWRGGLLGSPGAGGTTGAREAGIEHASGRPISTSARTAAPRATMAFAMQPRIALVVDTISGRGSWLVRVITPVVTVLLCSNLHF